MVGTFQGEPELGVGGRGRQEKKKKFKKERKNQGLVIFKVHPNFPG